MFKRVGLFLACLALPSSLLLAWQPDDPWIDPPPTILPCATTSVESFCGHWSGATFWAGSEEEAIEEAKAILTYFMIEDTNLQCEDCDIGGACWPEVVNLDSNIIATAHPTTYNGQRVYNGNAYYTGCFRLSCNPCE